MRAPNPMRTATSVPRRLRASLQVRTQKRAEPGDSRRNRPRGEGECAVKRVVTFAQAVHGGGRVPPRRVLRAPRAQQPDHGRVATVPTTPSFGPFAHVIGAHTDKQLSHADIGESRQLQHVGEHPTARRTGRGAQAYAHDESRVARVARRTLPARALRRLRQRHEIAILPCGFSTRRISANACQRVLEIRKRLSKDREVEHSVVEHKVMCVHHRVMDATLIAAWRRACMIMSGRDRPPCGRVSTRRHPSI